MIQIPERFQILNNLSPFEAGVRLLPFIVTIPVFSVIGSLVVAKYHFKHAYALLLGIAFQLVGAVLFYRLPNSPHVSRAQYGYQVLLGIGLGINNSVLVTAVPFMVEQSLISKFSTHGNTLNFVANQRATHSGPAMGAGMQFRYLGGVIGLGVVTTIFDSTLRPQLSSILTADEVSRVLQSTALISRLPAPLQQPVQEVFGNSFAMEWKALLGFICAQVPAAIMML